MASRFFKLRVAALLEVFIFFSLVIPNITMAWSWNETKQFKIKKGDENFLKIKRELEIEKGDFPDENVIYYPKYPETFIFWDGDLENILNQKINKEKFGDLTYGTYILIGLNELNFIENIYIGRYHEEFEKYFNNIIEQKTRLNPFVKDLTTKGSIDALTSYLDLKFGANLGKIGGLCLSTANMTNEVLAIWDAIFKLNKMILYDGLNLYLTETLDWDSVKYFMTYHASGYNLRSNWTEEQWDQLKLEFDNIHNKWSPRLKKKGVEKVKEQIKEEYKLLIISALKDYQKTKKELQTPVSETVSSFLQEIKNIPQNISEGVLDFFREKKEQVENAIKKQIEKTKKRVEKKLEEIVLETQKRIEKEVKKQVEKQAEEFERKMEKACVIKAVYGESPKLNILRDFRDKVLLKNALGKEFVKWYYKNSPSATNFIKRHSMIGLMTREIVIEPMIEITRTTRNIWQK